METMSPWVYVFALIATFWVGYHFGKKTAPVLEEVEDSSRTTYLFNVEIKNGIYYAFDRDTDEFLGQHEDIEYLTREFVAKKKPGYQYYLAMGDKP